MDGRSVHVFRRWSLSRPERSNAEGAAAWIRRRGRWRGRWCSTRTCPPPPLPGCYAIDRNGQLLYVGSTDQLARRLRHHGLRNPRSRELTRFGPPAQLNVRFSVSFRRGDHLAREFRLIQRLRPALNERKPRR